MPVKHFVLDPSKKILSKEDIEQIALDRELEVNETFSKKEIKAKAVFDEDCPLKHVNGRVVVKIDMELKNNHTFSNGMVIRRERKYNNFNFREVNPTNAIVVSAENIPKGSEILVDYMSIHDSYRIFGYKSQSNDVQYYSIKEDECYAWKDSNGEFQPMPNFEFGLRVFEPYIGTIEGVDPKVIKDVLYITTGKLKGKVAHTLKGCDYTLVFQGSDGKEKNIIRFRHSEDENYPLEELIAISGDLTDKVNSGKLLVGLLPNDCVKVKNEANKFY